MKALTLPRPAGKTFISIAAAGLVFVGWGLLKPAAPFTPASSAVSIPATENPVAPQLLPFTFRDTVEYFQDALAFAPEKIRPNEVVFRGGNHYDNFYTITVLNYGRDLLVKFEVMDDYGMTLLREFFEASFFQWRESEQMHGLLDGMTATKSLHLPRFNVIYEYDGRGEGAVISLLFTPRMRATGSTAP